jgi:isopentenyl phosphate kinase
MIGNPSNNFLETSMQSGEVISVATRFHLSDREFVHIAAAFAKANGHSVENEKFSYSTVRRRRHKMNNIIAKSIQENYVLEGPTPFLIVHWDGKIMEDTTAGYYHTFKEDIFQ